AHPVSPRAGGRRVRWAAHCARRGDHRRDLGRLVVPGPLVLRRSEHAAPRPLSAVHDRVDARRARVARDSLGRRHLLGVRSRGPGVRAEPGRQRDPLGYAFSADGWLDPGTRLLDIWLDGCTPLAALRTLVDEPRHMSVALHEVTHFVSLDNMLGQLLGYRALRANTLSDGLLHLCRGDGEVDPRLIDHYHGLRWRYALLMEAWRPLLEGLAVYVQTHV